MSRLLQQYEPKNTRNALSRSGTVAVEWSEAVLWVVSLIVAFAFGIVAGFLAMLRLAVDLIRQTKGLFGGGKVPKAGLIDLGIAFLRGELNLGALFGGGKR